MVKRQWCSATRAGSACMTFGRRKRAEQRPPVRRMRRFTELCMLYPTAICSTSPAGAALLARVHACVYVRACVRLRAFACMRHNALSFSLPPSLPPSPSLPLSLSLSLSPSLPRRRCPWSDVPGTGTSPSPPAMYSIHITYSIHTLPAIYNIHNGHRYESITACDL
jgi:hypothetical protein